MAFRISRKLTLGLRPRFAGYVAFQQSAGALVAECIKGKLPIELTIDRLNNSFAKAQQLT